MSKFIALPALLAFTALAACAPAGYQKTDVDRAAIGAAGGAAVGAILGNEESDVYKGAAAGALGGALCNDVGVTACQ